MRTSHLLLIAVAGATFGVILAAPGIAQDTPIDEMAEDAPPSTLTPQQQAMYDAWPPERQGQYDSWPEGTKTYYWSLSLNRQLLFWRLTDPDKVALSGMTGEEQENVWTRLESQAANQEPPEEPEPM